MKSAILSLTLLLSISAFGESYGFLNLDRNYNSCFVGIDADTLEFSGPVSNGVLTQEQRDTMQDCQRLKSQGRNTIISVRTTPSTQQQPNGVVTHFPDFHVECLEADKDVFEELLTIWRHEVRNSNFSRCL